MGSLQHVDRVDLEHGHTVDDPPQVAHGHRTGRPRVSEALRGQRDSPGLRE
jgi:hypothetical protein